MHIIEQQFSTGAVSYHFDADLSAIRELAGTADIVILTDENIYALHKEKLAGYLCISFTAGEHFKQQSTADKIIAQLVELEAGRNTLLVGLGGGVVTDMAGYVAAVYLRGIRCALVPTSILAMVDAAVGGKNGIDVGVYKNIVGTIRQPSFILYDYSFLQTLPFDEWVNGFAEIIKHACIRDAILFATLERLSLHDFMTDSSLVADLVEKNVLIKNAVVAADEFEKGDRKLLNFGHTIGHAIENLCELPHGHAVSIGMVAACNLSEQLAGLHFSDAKKIVELLAKYHLPVDLEADHEKVFEVLKMDKKRVSDSISFVLLKKIGEAFVQPVPLATLQQHIKEIL